MQDARHGLFLCPVPLASCLLKMNKDYKYIFGPVPSRRLGLSLGVDIIPLKTCTQNCLYCQLCVDAPQVAERCEYAPIDDVLDELKAKLAENASIDCITISGSGEPTLHSGIGRLIIEIKKLTDTMIVVITNGTLLWDENVRKELLKADAVMPSLDACDQATFEKINCPHNNVTFDKLVEGLIAFRKEFKGKFWLEVFMLEGINASDEQVEKFSAVIEKISPDKVQLNTIARPVAHNEIAAVSEQRLTEIAAKLGPKAEVIAKFSKTAVNSSSDSLIESIIATLKRRPCTTEGLAQSLGARQSDIEEQIDILLRKSIVRYEIINDSKFYIVI